MNIANISDLAAQIIGQDVDLAFGFQASAAPDVFVVSGFDGVERVFDEYEITVDLMSHDPEIDLHSLLDTPAALGIYDKYDEPRFIHGVIAEVERGQTGFDRTQYRAVLRPALHRLNYSSDSRIFQEKTIPEISKTILGEHGISDIEWQLALDHQNREYVVQYGETAYDFLRRIWAEEGIFFWFEHSESAHKMVISDAPLSMPVLPAAETLIYNAMTGGSTRQSYVSRFNQIERLRATRRMAADYTFKRPAYHQRHKSAQYAANGAKGDYELYQYPGRHKDPKAGQPFNDHALEAHRVEATTAEGVTNNVQLCAGFIFALTEHPDPTVNTQHRILEVIHHGTQPAALEEEAPDDAATRYEARFTTQPARLPYRPINPNPKPMVEGPQIAHVTGPAGEEIYTDEHGRVKIWFPWDRHSDKNEHSSTWVRVSQGWAGGAWGSMAIPRIGQEVIVDFLEGDPDQPIITGRTYHATNRPPYDLPANKTRMTIKSKTHKGDGYNELRFEDEAGREEVWMHAQKDHNTVIENDETHQIVHDRSKSVGNDQSESVGNDKSISVGHDHSESIGNNATISTGVDKTESVGQDVTSNVGRDVRYSVGQNQIDNYGKDHIENVGNILRNAVETDHQYEVGGNFKGQVAGAYIMDVGGNIKTNTGLHELMAFEKFVISGPGGKITLDGSGITLSAARINLKGQVTMGGSGSAQVPTLSLAAKAAQPIAEECPKEEE